MVGKRAGGITISVIYFFKDLLVFDKVTWDAVKNSMKECHVACRNGKKKGDVVCIKVCNSFGQKTSCTVYIFSIGFAEQQDAIHDIFCLICVSCPCQGETRKRISQKVGVW